MSEQLPPNVRYVEESYAETWPTATQYGSMQFGPVKEGLYVTLPLPLALSKLRVEDQWAWLQAKENEREANNTLLTWHMRLEMERATVYARVKATVIERVNEALSLGQIRNAVIRNSQTGKP